MILRQSNVPLPTYGRKHFFAGCETGFTAFVVLFWELWWLFCVDRTWFWQDNCQKICSPALKAVLRHLPFFFKQLGGVFTLMGGIVDKIRAKTFFTSFETSFTAFAVIFEKFCSYFSSMGGILAKVRAKTFHCWLWIRFYGICCSFLTTLVVFLRQLVILLPRYGRKYFFARFETDFTTFAVLFFEHLGGVFVLILYIVAKIRAKTFLHWFWNRFYRIWRSYLTTWVVILCLLDIWC